MSNLRIISTNPATPRKLGAFDAYVQDAQEEKLRKEYQEFRKNCARDLTAIAIAGGSIPSFDEWVRDYSHA